MQEAGMSIFLFLFCSRYHFWTLRLPIYYANIKSTLETLFLCWHFFQQPCWYVWLMLNVHLT